jgi:gamma-glutamyltranspeptidase / glutathione hydrolase
MVAAADQLATQAGMAILAQGGNAVDAAIATNAAIAVTGPHLCGMGGDLFALVHDGHRVVALNASGRAGSGSDPAQLRREGFVEMPFRHDIRSVTVPGCVDGWCSLHERFGRLPLAQVLLAAIRLADEGFPASPLLVASIGMLDPRAREALHELSSQAHRTGEPVRRPGAARALRDIADKGRDGFYLGEFGTGLRRLGKGLFDESDLAVPGATWVTPLARHAFGKTLHTIPPNSQGYLTLGAALLADQLELPDDPADPQWAHLLIEAATVASYDRPSVLHDEADGDVLLDAIAGRLADVSRTAASRNVVSGFDGDTTYLCTVDDDRMGVSLIQSNRALTSTSTTAGSVSRSRRAIRLSSPPDAVRRTRSRPRWRPTSTGPSRACSERWGATPNRRSSCRSRRGSSITSTARRWPSTPAASHCAARSRVSTPGPRPAAPT